MNLPSTSSLSSWGLSRAVAEGLGAGGDRFLGRLHAHVEFRSHVDAHAVARDERVAHGAGHLQAQRIHVDRDGFVEHGQDEAPAVDHNLLSAHAGAHECGLFRGAPVQALDHDSDREQRDEECGGGYRDVHDERKRFHGADSCGGRVVVGVGGR